MKLKKGSLVEVLDGYGIMQSTAVVERTDKAKGIVFVVEQLPNGKTCAYGVPCGSLKLIESKSKPTLGDVVRVLKLIFAPSRKEGVK